MRIIINLEWSSLQRTKLRVVLLLCEQGEIVITQMPAWLVRAPLFRNFYLLKHLSKRLQPQERKIAFNCVWQNREVLTFSIIPVFDYNATMIPFQIRYTASIAISMRWEIIYRKGQYKKSCQIYRSPGMGNKNSRILHSQLSRGAIKIWGHTYQGLWR